MLLNSILWLVIIAGILGLLIAIASSVFYVEEDTKVEEIAAMLPQFNCGACGTPGCQAMAEALVNKKASIEQCRPAKPEVKEAIKAKLIELDI